MGGYGAEIPRLSGPMLDRECVRLNEARSIPRYTAPGDTFLLSKNASWGPFEPRFVAMRLAQASCRNGRLLLSNCQGALQAPGSRKFEYSLSRSYRKLN